MKVLLWDFDGTLGYRDGMWGGTLVEIVRHTVPRRAVTLEQVRAIPKNGWPWNTPQIPHTHIRSPRQWWDALDPFFAGVLQQLGFEPPLAMRMARQARDVFPELKYWHLFEDTLATLRQLRERGWTHAILSNHVPELPEILRHVQLSPYIAGVFNSAETGYEKPHPQAFRNVIDAFPAAETLWMIGDSPTADIAGAGAAGLPAILVRRAHPDTPFQCEDLRGVPAILRQARPRR